MNKLTKILTVVTVGLFVLTSSAKAQLPDPGVKLEKGHTAIVITDPQVDFLSPKGVTWSLVGKNVTENKTVENLDRLMKIACDMDIPLFISPHYYFPTDLDWHHGGALEAAMHNLHMFERAGQLDLTGFDDSGSDWMPQYKKYINNGKTYVSSPHKLYGPESNDTVLQLRKRGIDQIILAGMSANLCTESHMREFMEQGFEVLVVKDAVAAAQVPGYDGYAAALVNFRMIANSVKTTDETIEQIKKELGPQSRIKSDSKRLDSSIEPSLQIATQVILPSQLVLLCVL
jgi:nicotinamidase-related amidase